MPHENNDLPLNIILPRNGIQGANTFREVVKQALGRKARGVAHKVPNLVGDLPKEFPEGKRRGDGARQVPVARLALNYDYLERQGEDPHDVLAALPETARFIVPVPDEDTFRVTDPLGDFGLGTSNPPRDEDNNTAKTVNTDKDAVDSQSESTIEQPPPTGDTYDNGLATLSAVGTVIVALLALLFGGDDS
jgi:hypothetical protein